MLEETEAAWRELPPRVRRRVHLALLPMDDADENAVIVNALQRRADVVVQKSLAEGFGLTVSEAMWKARPVVASDVGGIRDQIEDGVTAGWSSHVTCARSASRSAPCSTIRTRRSAWERRLRSGCVIASSAPATSGSTSSCSSSRARARPDHAPTGTPPAGGAAAGGSGGQHRA